MLTAIERITAPAKWPLSLKEIKQHGRIDHDEDDFLNAVLMAVTRHCEQYLRKVLITQQWKATFDCFENIMDLPNPPIQQIDSVEYYDQDDALQTLASSVYLLNKTKSTLVLAYNQQWPSVVNKENAISVTYTSGYGDDPADVPEDIRWGMRLLVGHFYENRENSAPITVSSVPYGLTELWWPHRWIGLI